MARAKKRATQRRSQAPPPAGRFERHRPLLERLLFVVALLGILTAVHLFIQQGRGFDRGCLGFSAPGTASATFDCEVVTESSAGKLFGVSNAVWGFLFYVVIASLTAALALWKAAPLVVLRQARAGLVGLGLLYSLYLSYVQYFELGELCALCLISASLVVVLALLTALYLFQSLDPSKQPMTARKRMRDGVLYGGLAALTLLLVGADVVYFNSLEAPAPAQAEVAQPVANADPDPPPAVCDFDSRFDPVDDVAALIDASDLVQGNPGASITLIEFFDPNCPHCKHLHPVMQSVLAEYGDRVRLVYKPIALPNWDFSIPQVAALFAARQAGKFPEMLDRQFAMQQQGGLSMEQLKGIAREIGMDANQMEQRIRGGIYSSRMSKIYDQGLQIGIRGVPAVLFNGRVIASNARSVDCLSGFIEEALQKTDNDG